MGSMFSAHTCVKKQNQEIRLLEIKVHTTLGLFYPQCKKTKCGFLRKAINLGDGRCVILANNVNLYRIILV